MYIDDHEKLCSVSVCANKGITQTKKGAGLRKNTAYRSKAAVATEERGLVTQLSECKGQKPLLWMLAIESLRMT